VRGLGEDDIQRRRTHLTGEGIDTVAQADRFRKNQSSEQTVFGHQGGITKNGIQTSDDKDTEPGVTSSQGIQVPKQGGQGKNTRKGSTKDSCGADCLIF